MATGKIKKPVKSEETNPTLTAGTNIQIDSVLKTKVGQLVNYKIITTTKAAISSGATICSGLEVPTGGYNGANIFLGGNHYAAQNIFRFRLQEDGRIETCDAIPNGTSVRFTLTYAVTNE